MQDFDAVVKGYIKMPGLFTFYRQREGGKDSIYMEVPEALLGRNLVLQATASSGTMSTPIQIFQGKPLNDIMFQIQVVDDSRVQFVIPSIENRAASSAQARRALAREFNGEILFNFVLKARAKDRRSVLFDVTPWLKGDAALVGDILKDSGAGYTFDSTNSYVDSVKSFPENAVVRTVHSLTWQGPANGSPQRIPFAVSYNLSNLPDDTYRPRIGDARVGFQAATFLDHSEPEKIDNRVNYIRRWNLEKTDPNAAVSTPKKPIVFYIDNAMPLEYREPTREGLLMWNPALERAGFKDAIIVKQMPDDADWDIADTRYNVVRWMVNIPFSTALLRNNELTGEILGASINFDASFAQFGASEYDLFEDGRTGLLKGGSLKSMMSLQCQYPVESTRSMLFTSTVIESLQTDVPKEQRRLIREFIRETVAHEMGHCLGLRHNFMGSKFLTDKELADPKVVSREGTTSSVMDYVPENIEAVGHPDVAYYSGVVGKYDKWAMEYGYKPIAADSAEGEVATLRAFASRTNEPGLAFLSDEMANDWDPDVLRFDMSQDTLAWEERMVQTSNAAIGTLADRHPKTGESYYEFARRFDTLRFIGITRPIRFAATFVGGLVIKNNFHGDPGEKPPVEPVSAIDQRRALDLICRLALEESSPGITEKQAAMLAGNPNGPRNQTREEDRLAPVLDQVSSLQNTAIDLLMDPERLSRVASNTYRSRSTFTLQELFSKVRQCVWSELATNRPISETRRTLQRHYLSVMSQIALGKQKAPSDATELASADLRDLESLLQVAVRKATDRMQKAHLLSCLSLAHHAQNAQASQ